MKNKIIVITGGNGAVAKEAAKRFSEIGSTIYIIVRNNIDEASEFIKSLPNQELNHRAFLSSITDTNALRSVVQEIKNISGRCDLLINSAGITKSLDNEDLNSYTDEIIDEILINNVRGTFSVIREFTPLLLNGEESLIINITSASNRRASQSNIIYGASKSALELITRSLSRTLAPKIRVVSVCPGMLETPTSGGYKPEGTNERIAKQIPLGRVGKASDVVATIEALATSLKYVNGSSILLDGGRLA